MSEVPKSTKAGTRNSSQAEDDEEELRKIIIEGPLYSIVKIGFNNYLRGKNLYEQMSKDEIEVMVRNLTLQIFTETVKNN